MAKYKTYAIPNPLWYGDTFIFRYNDDFGCYYYVKIDCYNKIEEIGIDLVRRMKSPKFIEDKKVEATRLQKSILNRISDELWYGKYNYMIRTGEIKKNKNRSL